MKLFSKESFTAASRLQLAFVAACTQAHPHTLLFNGLFSRTTWVRCNEQFSETVYGSHKKS